MLQLQALGGLIDGLATAGGLHHLARAIIIPLLEPVGKRIALLQILQARLLLAVWLLGAAAAAGRAFPVFTRHFTKIAVINKQMKPAPIGNSITYSTASSS